MKNKKCWDLDSESQTTASGLRSSTSDFPIHTIEKLQQKIHRLETASRLDDGKGVPSGCRAIDRMLPEDGYRRGTLIEWITPNSHSGGHGADFLSLMTAQRACEDGGAMVVVDPEQQFYPPAANALGINNGNLIVLRSSTRLNNRNENELYWAIEQALRCSAVAAVWGPLDRIGERWFRRFQLSAESSGAIGFFVRPASALNQPSWAEVQWQLLTSSSGFGRELSSSPSPTAEGSRTGRSKMRGGRNSAPGEGFQMHSVEYSGSKHLRKLRLQLHRCRGMLTGKTIDLELNTITGSVSEPTRTRRDHEQQHLSQRESARVPSSQAGPLSVAAKLAYSATGRCAKRA